MKEDSMTQVVSQPETPSTLVSSTQSCITSAELGSLKNLFDEKIKAIAEKKVKMIGYAQLKLDEKDWHGLADAAMDLRDMEAEINTLEEMKTLASERCSTS